MLRRTKVDIKKTAEEAGCSGIVAKVLVNRGIDTPEKIKNFFNVDINDMYSSCDMKDMIKGVEIIKSSIDSGKKILIYGDYDCDGVTSTAILYKTLKKCGANLGYHIPDRETEGYGMNKDRIKILREEGYEVIITCDNGISAVEEIKLAKDLGFTVVVTDHHELPFQEENGEREYFVPSADAVINPKRFDCNYSFKSLCGAGIAYKFANEILKFYPKDEKLERELLQFAAIGTICDVVDLVEENRIIAVNGLREISRTENLGLASLIEVLGVDKKNVKCYTIGFQIGPCINATGRLEKADISFELLTTEDPQQAKRLAKNLFEINKKRQDMTNDNVVEIIESLRGNIKDRVLVVYREHIHESIAGIVAGRVKEEFNLPTFVLTAGKEMPKGSGRSIEGYNMFEEMIKCKDYLHKFGGHPMAAGLSIQENMIDPFREEINRICALTEKELVPKLKIDNHLPLDYIRMDLIEELGRLEPFGKGNSRPVFAEKGLQVVGIKTLGQDGNTLKLMLRIPGKSKVYEAIGFNMVEKMKEALEGAFGACWGQVMEKPKGLKVDIAFYPALNTFKGKTSLVLKLDEIRVSDV